jgi:hypothetical protein
MIRPRGYELPATSAPQPALPRLKRFMVGVIGLVALLGACSGPARTVKGPDRNDAIITFDCGVADAEVWVNERFYVDGLKRGIAVGAGSYRIEVRHDRYHTFYLELTVKARERRPIKVELAEILP